MPGLGWQIGDYHLERVIANGKFGTVYKASDAHGRTFAIKLVPSTGSAEDQEKTAAERRGAMLQLQFGQIHDIVPKVYDCRSFEGFFGIVMEFVEARQMTDLIAEGALGDRAAVQYAICICDFLEKAHRFETVIDGERYERIVHGDLKPDHILILGPDRIKVLDFGIAKALAETTVVTTNNWGTIPYASPERLTDSGHVNEQVDLWSVGVMLYEMVSGHRPYARLEHDTIRLDRAIRLNEERDPLPVSCPPPLTAIIDKLLAYQQERRYTSAAAVKADLEAYLRNEIPAAFREYDTPQTIRVGAAVDGSPAIVTGPSRLVPATVPLPPDGAVPQGSQPVGRRATPTLRASRIPRLVQHATWPATLFLLIALFATEAVAWVGAERMRASLGTLDGPAVAGTRRRYDQLRRWSLLHLGPRLRLDPALKSRLVSVADEVLLDYRHEEPAVAEVQWRQAREALRWASELSPNDANLGAKALDCEAHLDRIDAQRRTKANPVVAKQIYKRAIDKFRRATQLDPAAPDPYLGLSRIFIYGVDDVDAAAAAVHEAEKRGFMPGRRESAQLGDGYLRRAERSRRQRLFGEQKRRALESARDDFQRCVAFFEPIVGFGRAAENLDFCRRRLDLTNQELDWLPVRTPES